MPEGLCEDGIQPKYEPVTFSDYIDLKTKQAFST